MIESQLLQESKFIPQPVLDDVVALQQRLQLLQALLEPEMHQLLLQLTQISSLHLQDPTLLQHLRTLEGHRHLPALPHHHLLQQTLTRLAHLMHTVAARQLHPSRQQHAEVTVGLIHGVENVAGVFELDGAHPQQADAHHPLDLPEERVERFERLRCGLKPGIGLGVAFEVRYAAHEVLQRQTGQYLVSFGNFGEFVSGGRVVGVGLRPRQFYLGLEHRKVHFGRFGRGVRCLLLNIIWVGCLIKQFRFDGID